MTGRSYAVSRRIVRNRIMPSHLIIESTNLQFTIGRKLKVNRCSTRPIPEKWRTSSDRQVNSANPPLQVESRFYIRAIVVLARAHRQSAATFSHLLIASVDTICSPPYWDQYVIGTASPVS